MRNINKTQLLLILAGVLVGILIYLAPGQKSEVSEQIADSDEISEDLMEHDHDHEDTASSATADLDSTVLKFVSIREQKATQIADLETKLSLYDTLIQFSIKRNIPSLVAKYTEEKAKLVPTEKNWILSGDNYFKAFRLSKKQSKEMIIKAISSYEKALELNPENLDAQTSIGVAYVEGATILGEMPMKGIGILLEVVNKDPKNINALTNLGYFAIQSGQYEKAIERFTKIIEIDPENAEAYLYLTDVYLSQNDKEKGLKTLEKYKSLVNDPLLKQQVDQYMKEIKSN